MPTRQRLSLIALLPVVALLTACDSLEHEPITLPPPAPTHALVFTPAPPGAQLRPFGKDDSGLIERRRSSEAAPSSYGCIVTTLLPETSELAYRHRPFYVGFPETIVAAASGQVELLTLTLTDAHAPARATPYDEVGIVRIARCLVPKADGVAAMLQAYLGRFGKGSWAGEAGGAATPSLAPAPSSLFDPSHPTRRANGAICTEWTTWETCMFDLTTFEEIPGTCTVDRRECTEWTWIEEEDPGSGGDHEGDWNNDDANKCQANPDGTFSDLCVSGGPSDQPLPPAPCNTGDPIMDHLRVQAGFDEAWKASNYTDAAGNINPLTERQEQGFWIIDKGNGQYDYEPWPSDWLYTPCGIGPVLPISYPPNLVGYVHTHPFKHGEDKSSVCGEGQTSHSSGMSDDGRMTNCTGGDRGYLPA